VGLAGTVRARKHGSLIQQQIFSIRLRHKGQSIEGSALVSFLGHCIFALHLKPCNSGPHFVPWILKCTGKRPKNGPAGQGSRSSMTNWGKKCVSQYGGESRETDCTHCIQKAIQLHALFRAAPATTAQSFCRAAMLLILDEAKHQSSSKGTTSWKTSQYLPSLTRCFAIVVM
jgi:hypothetical protein